MPTTTTTVDALLETTVLFAVVLAFSLVIERILEILKCVYDVLDSRGDWHRFWTRRAGDFQVGLERRMRVFEYVEPKRAAAALKRFQEMLLTRADGYDGTVPTISGDAVRALAVKLASKVIGIGIGVFIAMKLELDIVTLWNLPDHAVTDAVERYLQAHPGVRQALTGAVMGFSATLVHKIITSLEDSRRARTGGAQA